MKQVTLSDAEHLAHRLVETAMDYGEPVPPFKARYPGKLESTLEQPFTHINGRYVYWTIQHRAAVYFYLIIKNHPFTNGNKRMAVAIFFTFLFINDRWAKITPEEMYDIAKAVAKSSPSEKDEIILTLKKFIKQRLEKLTTV